jgi:hypothetical protein
MRSARSDPKFSIAVVSGRECQQIQPGHKRAVALRRPTDIGYFCAVPAMDPMLDPRSHLFAARDTMGPDVLVQIREPEQSSSPD